MNKYLLIFDLIMTALLIYNFVGILRDLQKARDARRAREIVETMVDGPRHPRAFKRIADMSWDEYRHYCDTGERPPL